jgi:3-oxoacyl-[acyl-carrier protein] reductase
MRTQTHREPVKYVITDQRSDLNISPGSEGKPEFRNKKDFSLPVGIFRRFLPDLCMYLKGREQYQYESQPSQDVGCFTGFKIIDFLVQRVLKPLFLPLKKNPMTVLITGASRGIGEALAYYLTGEGDTVILVARNRHRLEKIAGECNEKAEKTVAYAIPFDLTELKDLESEFLSAIGRITRRLDALVNNAGQLIRKPFVETSMEEARRLFDANFFAPAQLTRICLPLLRESGRGHVVNITSMSGFQGSRKFGGLSYYSASKAALGGLTEVLAEELKEEGIRVNGVALGSVQTEMFAESFPGVRVNMLPGEMAEFLAWFLREGGRFMNGKVIPVSTATP